ncbi:hypothetical protein IC575_023017 [Cucumis melo]
MSAKIYMRVRTQFTIKTHKNKSISIIDRLKKQKKKKKKGKKLIYLRGRINVINTIGSMGILRRKKGRWRGRRRRRIDKINKWWRRRWWWSEIRVSSKEMLNTVIPRPRRGCGSRVDTAPSLHSSRFSRFPPPPPPVETWFSLGDGLSSGSWWWWWWLNKREGEVCVCVSVSEAVGGDEGVDLISGLISVVGGDEGVGLISMAMGSQSLNQGL